MMHWLLLLSLTAVPHPTDRAQHAMGFDQRTTTHHFHLERGGGTIEVTANDPSDTRSRDQIRMHLKHIAAAFQAGDFTLPFLVHATEPPGVSVMTQRRARMTYRFEDLPHGGKVVVRTTDAAARAALHDFLRFQIREHRTGDPLEVPSYEKSR